MKWGIDIKDIIESNIQDLRLKVSLSIDEARNKTMAELEEVKLKRINKQLNKYKRYEV